MQRGGVLLVPIEDIIPSPVQPRQRFEEDMKELKAGLQDLSDMAVYQRKAAREYLACEERAAGMIESISNQ